MFVLIGQQSKNIASVTNLSPLNATIDLRNMAPTSGGSGDGDEIGAVLCLGGTRAAPIV